MKHRSYYLIFILIIGMACNTLTVQNHESTPTEQQIPTDTNSDKNLDPIIEWLTFSGTGNVSVFDMAQGNNGSAYTLEESPEYDNGHNDLLLTKTTIGGKIEWQVLVTKVLDSSNSSLVLDNEGNIYISGSVDQTWGNPIIPFTPKGSYPWDVFVAKINNQGSVLWNTFIGSNLSSTITIGKDDNIYILKLGGHDEDPVLVRLNKDGEILQNKTLNFNTPTHDHQYKNLEIDSDGNLYTSGVLFNGKDLDYFISKYLNSGELVWETIVGGDGEQDTHFIGQSQIKVDGNGNIFLHGYSNTNWGTPVNPYDGGNNHVPQDDYEYGFEDFIVKLDNNGNLLWNTFLNKLNTVYDIALDETGSLIISGAELDSDDPVNSKYHSFIAKMDTNGVLLWDTIISKDDSGGISKIAYSESQYIYVSGTSSTTFGNPINQINNDKGRDVFIAKLKLP